MEIHEKDMSCQRNGCDERSTKAVETWIGSVPVWYNTCDEHALELEKENH